MKMFPLIEMMKLKNPVFRKPVGIVEIGNDWLKIAEKEPGPDGGVVKKLKFIKLAQIKENVSFAIADAFKTLKINKKSVILYIPRHLVIVRNLELPSTNPKEIADMINLQIGKQTPYSKEEIISGYKMIACEREGYSKALLVIVQRNLVAERVETLEKAGILIDAVAVTSEGVYNWFSGAYVNQVEFAGKEDIVVLDIDSNYSDLISISNGQLTFTKSIFIGANHLIEDPPPGGWREKFIEEMRRSLERHRGDESGVKVKKIFLSGSARNITNLDSILSAALGIQVENTDPKKGVEIKVDKSVIDDPNFRFISFTPLFGMPVGGKKPDIDITPIELNIKKTMDMKRRQLMAMGALLAAILMIVSLLVLIKVQGKNVYLAQLKQALSRIEEGSEEIEKMRLGINLIRNRMDSKFSAVNILNEIYRLTPREIYFTSVNIAENQRLLLRGRGQTMSEVFKFVTILEDSPLFENVKTVYTTTKRQDGEEYAEFEIMCSYQNT